MIELAQHIEILLLENDCVIVPGFGGFVAHYSPAQRIEREDLFLPPTRTIGFNSQLKLNDGVLVQSYMTKYDTNFSDAVKRIEKEVKLLMSALFSDGKVVLGNIGEIKYTIHDTYNFIAYNNKITTPGLYGLDSFKMAELAVLKQSKEEILVPTVPKKEKGYKISIRSSLLRHTVAVAAAVLLFFVLSTPIENTYIQKENYAQLLPADLFERIENKSVTTTPVIAKTAVRQHNSSKRTAPKPIAIGEAKAATSPLNSLVSTTNDTTKATGDVSAAATEPAVKIKTNQVISKNYHLIVAGSVTLKNAEELAATLKQEGYNEAKVLNTNGKIRVSIMSFPTNEEATKELLQLRKIEAYQNAWVLAK